MGAVHAGELAYVRVRATDPIAGRHIRDAEVEAWLYPPGIDPEADAAARETPSHRCAMRWDETALCYHGYVDTTGFVPGEWHVMVALSGGNPRHAGYGFTTLGVRP